MQYRTLPGCDLSVSVIGLGCNAFGTRADQHVSRLIIDSAIDAGVTLFDTAEAYGGGRSEEILGEAFVGRRDAVVLSTKGGGAGGAVPGTERAHKGSSRAFLRAALERSLRRLRTDYIDIYFLHYFDPDTPPEETLATLDEFVLAGKVRYAGVSNYEPQQLDRMLSLASDDTTLRPSVVQASYSLVDRTAESGLFPVCAARRLGVFAFWPLGGGLLSGKYQPGAAPPEHSRVVTQPIFAKSFSEKRLLLSEHVAKLAGSAGCSTAQLAIAWVLARAGISSALTGATNLQQLHDNVGAATVALKPIVQETLDELSRESTETPFR